MSVPFHVNYLNGLDWFASALIDQCRHGPSRGQFFLVVLEGRDPGLGARLRDLVEGLGPIRPWLSGRIGRHRLNLAPCWRPGEARPVPFRDLVLGDEEEFDGALSRFGNTPLPPDAAVAVLTARTADRGWGVFKFSHVLFDGRGGELFLNALGRDPARLTEGFPEQPSAGLTRWVNRFRCGRRVNRARLAILADRRIAGWRSSRGGLPGRVRYQRICLDEVQAASLAERAERELGPYMWTPYLAAALGKALAETLDGRRVPGDVLLQMSTDLRGFGCPAGARYFNQWSLAPLPLRREEARDFGAAARSLRAAIFENVRTGFLRDFREAALLWRILPVPVFSRLVSKLLKADAGTCLFSHIPGTSLPADAPAGQGVTNLVHIPLVPPQPGLGVIFSGFRGRLNGVVSYQDGILTEAEAKTLANRLGGLLA